MCRLLGSVSRTPVTIDQILGQDRAAFLELACTHGDGWGHAWSEGTAALQVRKAADSARESADFANLASNQAAPAALTHLRWATMGLGIRPENTHPFTDGKLAFAHNGSIDPPTALDELIDPALAARRRGDTDSERFFLALLSRMVGRSESEALIATIDAVVAGPSKAQSLNCLFLTPTALYAVCSYDPLSQEEADYYPLLYRATEQIVVVASTGWTDSADWHTLSNGQMLVIERGSLRTSVVTVATPNAVARGTR